MSLTRRQQNDADDVGELAFSRVFEPGTLRLWGPDTWIVYFETASRFDTRSVGGPPSSGVMADVPFTELARQPDYRGTDNRRDYVSLVGSLDYVWAFAPFAALRVFVDAATVGPAVERLPLDELRVVVGGGIDIFSPHADIVKLWLAGSVDGFHLLVGIGSPLRFGDSATPTTGQRGSRASCWGSRSGAGGVVARAAVSAMVGAGAVMRPRGSGVWPRLRGSRASCRTAWRCPDR